MKLNIFKVSSGQLPGLVNKFKKSGLNEVGASTQDGWQGQFYFSTTPDPVIVSWVEQFSGLIGEGEFKNRAYFGAMIFTREKAAFVVTFGKAHFYARPFCDFDFGIELAKRIADKADIRQTSSRRFQGNQRKDIRSFVENSQLNVVPGSSVEFLQARIRENLRPHFGKAGKFGSSCLLVVQVDSNGIGEILSQIQTQLGEAPAFELPHTIVLSDPEEIASLDQALVNSIMGNGSEAPSEVVGQSFDLYGVDFVFGGNGTVTLKSGYSSSQFLENLSIEDVRAFVSENEISADKILDISVQHHTEDGRQYSQRLRQSVDFVSGDEYVALSAGRWLRFNEDYIQALDKALDEIEVEETEPAYKQIAGSESSFNLALAANGYEVADKDFTIAQISANTQVEAWDLRRGDTVYAVKFGEPPKLNYVVDQASIVISLIHADGLKEKLPSFGKYCLWLGYEAVGSIAKVSDSRSIILKQKIEEWARQCRDAGIDPVIKLSHKAKVSKRRR
ncbi:DUF6119 family protein [Mycetocola sp. JXN-3]|uniref:DUF6119 family protein n=1 Tax=Mycetocola sp. JXN-3 TaxID=2116510 RepID=UPI00165CF966|nr:DUF6119 family protein [Mycetocola sp. JXN-3]